MHLVSYKSVSLTFYIFSESMLTLSLAACFNTAIALDPGTAESPTPAFTCSAAGRMGQFVDYHRGFGGNLLIWGLFIGWLAVTELAWFSLVLH